MSSSHCLKIINLMKLSLLSTLMLSPFCFSANEGVITSLSFAGESMGSHPNVVQVQIEGGFDAGSCNKKLAAIRKRDEHLISAALSAYAMGTPIKVYIDQGDVYFEPESRCVIVYLTL